MAVMYRKHFGKITLILAILMMFSIVPNFLYNANAANTVDEGDTITITITSPGVAAAATHYIALCYDYYDFEAIESTLKWVSVSATEHATTKLKFRPAANGAEYTNGSWENIPVNYYSYFPSSETPLQTGTMIQ